MGHSPRLLLLLALLPAGAWADQVLLKTGRSLEGIISGEDAAELTLDFGYGSTVLQKSDIQTIRRSAAKERQALKRRFLSQAAKSGAIAPPPGAEELSTLLEEARRGRETAQDAHRDHEQLLGEQEELAAQSRELRARQPGLAAALASANPRSRDYNALVGDVNANNVRLQSNAFEYEEAGRKLAAGETAVGKYLGDYNALRRYAAANLKRLRAGAADEAAAAFFADVDQELAEMARDFKRDAVASRRVGEHLVVDVLFNGRVHAPLMVDTGASQITISPKVASELDLQGGEVLHATLADGKQIEGRLHVLESVSVGGSRVEKTPVVVLGAPGPQAEGLLGMSFLKNFMFQLDMANSRLILEGLAPASAPKP